MLPNETHLLNRKAGTGEYTRVAGPCVDAKWHWDNLVQGVVPLPAPPPHAGLITVPKHVGMAFNVVRRSSRRRREDMVSWLLSPQQDEGSTPLRPWRMAAPN